MNVLPLLMNIEVGKRGVELDRVKGSRRSSQIRRNLQTKVDTRTLHTTF